MQNVIITIEAPIKCGKSTLSLKIEELLRAHNIDCSVIDEELTVNCKESLKLQGLSKLSGKINVTIKTIQRSRLNED